MALYSRLIPSQARAADEVLALLLNYPRQRRAEGVTVFDLMRDYPDQLKDHRSVLAAVDLLHEEGKVLTERSTGQADPLEAVRVYPRLVREIPPSQELFDHREEHPEGQRLIVIDFYKTSDGNFFVWPYINRVRQDASTAQHFQVLGHFADQEAARESTLVQGRTLIAVGFEPGILE